MAAPTRESILLAMKSDLGLGRVDDLELENGQRGRTIRPGDASYTLPGNAIAPPRKTLPVANKWIDAIKKGDFDDDDAEAVKGLDRIGGGRLHALNAAPSIPARHFPAARRPPPGLPPPGFGAPPVIHPPGFKHARSMSSTRGKVTAEIAQRAIFVAKSKMQAPPGTGPVSTPGKGSALPAKTPTGRASDNSDTKAAAQLVVPKKEVVYPPDPEPQGYVYKEPIHVADRLAKGAGAVYLVASSASGPSTVHIYSKGSRYLEYPVLSMCNYMSSSTMLIPQFKEEDGVSITTTSIVFGSQDKIVKFMTAIKTLQAGKQLEGAAVTQPKELTKAAAATPEQPKEPTKAAAVAPEQHKAPAKAAAVSASVPHSEQSPPEPTATTPVLHVDSKPVASEPTNGQTQHNVAVACDLLDLSQPEAVAGTKKVSIPRGPSAYAMDLGSLNFSAFETATESHLSKIGLEYLQESEDEIWTDTTETKVPATEEIFEAAVSRPETPKKEVFRPEVSQPEPSQPETPNTTVQARQPSPEKPATAEPLESLQRHLLDILPTFEAMNKIICSLDEKDRESAARSVYARLSGKQPDSVDFNLSSAEQLLRALVTKSTKPQAFKPPSLAASKSLPRYDPVDMILLRKNAVAPPEKLFKLDFLPRPGNYRVIKPENAPGSASRRSSITTSPRRTGLKPEARPFQPSPVSKRAATGLKPQFASFTMAPELQAPIVSPTVLSDMSNKTNISNMDLLTASMARLALPDAKSAATQVPAQAPPQAPVPTPVQASLQASPLDRPLVSFQFPPKAAPKTPALGLRSSRWATTNDSSIGTKRSS